MNDHRPIAGQAADASGLSAQWIDGIVGNPVRGCEDAERIAAMNGKGFDPVRARAAVDTCRGFVARVPRGARPLAVYRPDPPRIGSANVLTAVDRPVTVGFAMTDPNIAMFTNLLSAEECERLIVLARDRLARSTVVDRAFGEHQVIDARTSDGLSFRRGGKWIATKWLRAARYGG